METKTDISERLKHLRKRSKFTLRIIANYLGTSVSCYQHYENSRAAPPLHILIRLASLYNFTLDELVGDAKPQTPKIEERYRMASPEERRIVNFILKLDC